MLLVQGGRVLRPDFDCAPADILVDGDAIADIVAPGTVKDVNALRIDAVGKLVIPGLVNGHNHAQTNLAKGLFDRYTLETYLNAVPWATGRRTVEDHYLSSVIGAAEMVRKGCTASYDMFAEFPLPTAAGVEAVAKGYADVGMRATIAPMMADRSFYEAIPGLADALPEALREQALKIKYASHEQSLAACRQLIRDWKHGRDLIRPALGPTIPASLLGRVPRRLPRPRARARRRPADARRRIEDAGDRGAKEVRQVARRPPRFARSARAAVLRVARGLARRRRPRAARRSRCVGVAQPRLQHEARLRAWRMPGACSIAA